MQTFYTSTPAWQPGNESSFLTLEDGTTGRRFRIEWATFEGSGNPQRWNEDSTLVAYRHDAVLLAVFDGVTPVPTASIPNGGHLVSRSAVEGAIAAFKAGVSDAADLLIAANGTIRQVSGEHSIIPGDVIHTLATTGTLVVIDFAAGEVRYASISDSGLVIKRVDALADRLTGNRVARFDDSTIKASQAAPDHAQALADPESAMWQRVIHQHQFQNAPDGGGYGVLNGMNDEQVRLYIETGAIPMTTVERLILFTDGAELEERPTPPDVWQRFDADIFRLGTISFLQHIRALEDEDPQRTRYPRVKLHDDSTLITVRMVADPE